MEKVSNQQGKECKFKEDVPKSKCASNQNRPKKIQKCEKESHPEEIHGRRMLSKGMNQWSALDLQLARITQSLIHTNRKCAEKPGRSLKIIMCGFLLIALLYKNFYS